MKIKLKICWFLAVILNISGLQLSAIDFQQIDYIEKLQNHPIYQNYEPETGRFKGTKSEIIPIETLQKNLEKQKNKVEKIKDEKGKLVESSLIFSIGSSENDSWKKIAALDKQISELNSEIDEIIDLIELDGVPLQNEISIVVSQITEEINNDLLKNISSDTIILNKLPFYRKGVPCPEINNYSEGYFNFLKNKDKDSLIKYINFEYQIGLLFPCISESILYKKENHEKQ